MLGGWGVPGVNVNGKFLEDLNGKRGIFLANTYFQQKLLH